MINGKIIDGRYEIIEEIGRGGMAIVYRAKCMVLNRYVAIKVLRPEHRDDAEFIKRFKIEAQSAGSLTHPNIVSVYDVGHEDDMEYIVMEYVEGITLKQYLSAKGVLPWKEAVDYASQICAGLEHAHKKGIVHKDIKPENIMITKEGILKITDFGIAKAVNQGTIATGGLTMGSVHYFSPEQARGSFIDTKTDLYSLGVLLYEMIAGRLPFEGESAISVAMQHLESEPARPSVFNPSVPKSLEAVILKAMKKEQTERYQTATQMLIDLKKVYVGSEVRYESGEEYTKKFTPVNPDEIKNKPEGTPVRRSGAAQSSSQKRSTSGSKTSKSKKKKKGDVLGIVTGICAGIAILAIIFLIYLSTAGSSNELECPVLEGLTCEEALDKIERIKGSKLTLVYEDGSEVSADDEGIIVSQDPDGGKRIKKDTEITIILGDEDADVVDVPSVKNMLEAQAISSLEKAGFRVSISPQDSDEVPEGRVIGTSPSGTAYEGATITIYVSTGESYTKVPDLLGKTESEAKSLLEEADLKLGEVTQVTSAKEKGIVVSQSLEEGDKVKKNRVVDISISNGKGEASPSPSASAEPSGSPDQPETTPSAKPTSNVTPANPAS